jgi:hypothetical protein
VKSAVCNPGDCCELSDVQYHTLNLRNARLQVVYVCLSTVLGCAVQLDFLLRVVSVRGMLYQYYFSALL